MRKSLCPFPICVKAGCKFVKACSHPLLSGRTEINHQRQLQIFIIPEPALEKSKQQILLTSLHLPLVSSIYFSSHNLPCAKLKSFFFPLFGYFSKTLLFFLVKCYSQVILVLKNLPASADVGDMSLIPGLGRSCGEGMATPSVFLFGKSHGQRSLLRVAHLSKELVAKNQS